MDFFLNSKCEVGREKGKREEAGRERETEKEKKDPSIDSDNVLLVFFQSSQCLQTVSLE